MVAGIVNRQKVCQRRAVTLHNFFFLHETSRSPSRGGKEYYLCMFTWHFQCLSVFLLACLPVFLYLELTKTPTQTNNPGSQTVVILSRGEAVARELFIFVVF